MLETELRRFAAPASSADNGRTCRVTRESLEAAFVQGLNVNYLEEWFRRRTGAPPPPSVYLLIRAITGETLHAEKLLVLDTGDSVIADGLLQFPATRNLCGTRLGPHSITVPFDKVEPLRQVLGDLGVEVRLDEQSPSD